jgi:cholest-4-en-3-one 26-monooxygenase
MAADFAAPNPAIDLMDPATHSGDPWPLYNWLREESPVYWDPINELWCVSRYDDIVAVAQNPKQFWSTEGNVPKMPADPSFINLDGRAHKNRRKLVSALFMPKAIAKMEDHIRDAVDTLIDEVIEQGHCEFVKDIAAPLPIRIICEMTGIPEEWHGFMLEWMDVFVQGGNGPDHVTMEVNEAFINFGALHMELVDQRREEPKDDLLSLWVNAEIDGEKLDEDQLLFEHTMMMIGGSETARNAISGGVEALSTRPEQRDWLLNNPEGCPNAMEEATRWVTPFVRMSRTATEDCDLVGTPVKKGDEVIMLYPPANRDPRRWTEPESFDIHRDFRKTKNLAFGYGAHFCIGAHLARLEGQIVFEQLLKRMPDWRVAGDTTKQVSSFVRGLTSLPLEFTPGSRR